MKYGSQWGENYNAELNSNQPTSSFCSAANRLRIVSVDFTSVMPDFNQGNNGNLGKYCPPVTNWIWYITRAGFSAYLLCGRESLIYKCIFAFSHGGFQTKHAVTHPPPLEK